MHAVIIIYGDAFFINEYIQCWRHKYLPLIMKSEGCPDKTINVSVQVRLLPFGLYELVFPKEHAELILTTLNFGKKTAYNLDKKIFGISPLKLLKKFLGIKDTPKYNSDKRIVMPKYDVSIIPIGVKYDDEMTETTGEFTGYTHEAL